MAYIVEELRTRAKIRREIRHRQAGLSADYSNPEKDKIADLCDRAANEIEYLNEENDEYVNKINDLEMRLHVCADDRKRIKEQYYKLKDDVYSKIIWEELRTLSDPDT
jgi:chromosome segregation ATPase